MEEPDEENKNRKIDLVAAACGVTVIIEGRVHTDFDTIMPVECKRLPTPKGSDRDEREYVVSRFSSTGGIYRFKAEHHGANHPVGAMIAYLQAETSTLWIQRVKEWIKEMIDSGEVGWSASDYLIFESDDTTERLTVLRSTHSRQNKSPIQLRHLWLSMN
jgi:hypothetical protein